MTPLAGLAKSIPALYVVMLLPGWGTIYGLFTHQWYDPAMLRTSGILSIQLLALTLAVTPTVRIIGRVGRGLSFGRWLLKRRRHFGLGSFAYGVVHLLHYLLTFHDSGVLIEHAMHLDYAMGWAAFAIFLALAVTSTKNAVATMGRRWKPFQRLVYAATLFAFVHWFLFDFRTEEVVLWAAAFLALKVVQIVVKRLPRSSSRSSIDQ